MKFTPDKNAAIRKAVRSYNAKIDRAMKNPKYKDVILPPKVTAKEIKSRITSANDYKRELNSLNRIKRPDAFKAVTNPQGVTITKYERKEIGIKLSVVNRRRGKQRRAAEEAEVTAGGVKTGFKRGEMYTNRLDELRPKKNRFDTVRNKKEFEKFARALDKMVVSDYETQQEKLYKSNYLKGIEQVFGQRGSVLISKAQKIPAARLIALFYSNQEATIDFIYDPLDLEFKASIIDEILQNEIDQMEAGY